MCFIFCERTCTPAPLFLDIVMMLVVVVVVGVVVMVVILVVGVVVVVVVLVVMPMVYDVCSGIVLCTCGKE